MSQVGDNYLQVDFIEQNGLAYLNHFWPERGLMKRLCVGTFSLFSTTRDDLGIMMEKQARKVD